MKIKFVWALVLLGAVFFNFPVSQAQGVDATIDLARFKLTDSAGYAELYVTIDGNSVVYQKNKSKTFQAAVSMNVEVTNAAGTIFYDKLLLRSPVVADTAVAKAAFTMQKRIPLKNGTYTLHISAADVNRKQEPTTLEIPLEMSFNGTAVQVSDIQLLESFEKTSERNEFTKNGFKLVSYVAAFYPKELPTLKFYSEVYNLEKVAGKEEPVLLFYRIQQAGKTAAITGHYARQLAAPVNVLLAELDISQLASGNYELVIDVRDKENKSLATRKKFFQRSNPIIADNAKPTKDTDLTNTFAERIDSAQLSYYLLSHLPIANTAEAASIKALAVSGTVQQKRNYLFYFWRRRSEPDAEKLWKDYLSRIEYVTGAFGHKTFKAYESDQGRVYLQYGPPNQVQTERNDPNRPSNNSDSKPYQIWQYYKIKNQSGRIFVFTQRNLGSPGYDLIHSNAIGEVNNPNWRQEVSQRFSGNERFDRNSNRRNDD